LEESLGRVINPENAGKERTRLTRATVLALRELMRQTQPDEQTKDLAAFIALALKEITDSIDASVEAWEKRGYWVKADRFRMDWHWAEQFGNSMRKAVLEEDWPGVAQSAASVAAKLGSVKVPQRHGLGTPWTGAYKKLQKDSSPIF
jgi:hypothetical protein